MSRSGRERRLSSFPGVTHRRLLTIAPSGRGLVRIRRNGWAERGRAGWGAAGSFGGGAWAYAGGRDGAGSRGAGHMPLTHLPVRRLRRGSVSCSAMAARWGKAAPPAAVQQRWNHSMSRRVASSSGQTSSSLAL